MEIADISVKHPVIFEKSKSIWNSAQHRARLQELEVLHMALELIKHLRDHLGPRTVYT